MFTWSLFGTSPRRGETSARPPAMIIAIAIVAIVPFVTKAAIANDSIPAEREMVSAAHPLAANAGRDILAQGGSAVDAAIAMQVVLSFVEPQSSGVGGGAFLMHWDAEDQNLQSFDGRETAPKAVTEGLFLNEKGRPISYRDAVPGGRAVGVPGVFRMLAMAHKQHGKLPWADLMQPAIKIAGEGFAITPRLHGLLTRYEAFLTRFSASRGFFYTEDGKAKPVGAMLQSTAYADVLRLVAEKGADAFYEGPIAKDIVDAVTNAEHATGMMTLADLASYSPKERDAVCAPYREHKVCSMGPPSSGATTMLSILGLLEGFNMKSYGPNSLLGTHLFAEASRIAFADRDRYVADPAFVDIPVKSLVDRDYLKTRRALISLDRAIETQVQPGKPGTIKGAFADHDGPDVPSTTHFVAVDSEGHVASMTASIQTPFGSLVMVRGFLLNNELTDFSFVPRVEGEPVANRAEGGKRPRSSMTPTLVFDPEGRFRLAIGSPGGSRIIDYTTKVVVGVLDWELDVQAAIDLPNIINRNRGT
ncbi:MAG: gamma-glutamyltransferase, partial [Pseudomonadota bacterium]